MGASTEKSQTFSELDTNQDGVVSAEELAARPDDVTEEMAANLFKSLDTDGSGGLTATEYAAKWR
jgi:Ca2+-binding EF-hand superfamily protein